jgi:hypothetical protein
MHPHPAATEPDSWLDDVNHWLHPARPATLTELTACQAERAFDAAAHILRARDIASAQRVPACVAEG